MNLGHVIGSIWATRKDPSLEGKRMLLVQPLFADGSPRGRPLAALDTADAGPGDRVLYVTSAECLVLAKLAWYRKGGEVSDQQWRDVLGVLKVQGHLLDLEFLRTQASALNSDDLLERSLVEAGL